MSQQLENLSAWEWNELQALRRAISENPASVHPDRMERFTQLFARTLVGKGDPMPYNVRAGLGSRQTGHLNPFK
jgi:hypothetical protein